MTYFTFITGLFSCNPLITRDRRQFKQYANRLLLSWKFFIILFQLSFLITITITVVYWGMIHQTINMQHLNWKRKLSLYMDHSVPPCALLSDYLLGCSPFVRRHFLIILLFCTFYISVLMAASINGYPPYTNIDWNTLSGTFMPILIMFLALILFYILEYLTRKKLKFHGGDRNIKMAKILKDEKRRKYHAWNSNKIFII